MVTLGKRKKKYIKLNFSLILKDVLFVPAFKFNLFSVSSFIGNSQLTVSFFNDRFIIQDPHLTTTISKSRRMQNLYVLDVVQPRAEFLTNHVSFSTWHNRFGHPSFKVMESLKNKIKCDTFNSSKLDSCICPLVKQRRLPFIYVQVSFRFSTL